MIQSWKSETARQVFLGRAPKGFPADLVKAARRRLERLNAATMVEDLRSPPGHRLHRLGGDRDGQWSTSVNDQFRICFVWSLTGPEQVEFVDYHGGASCPISPTWPSRSPTPANTCAKTTCPPMD